MAAAIVIILAIACSIAWARPLLSLPEKDEPGVAGTTAEPIKNIDSTTNMSEESQLIQQLENDGLINQVKGFLVEKKQNLLFIDGHRLPDNIAGKYIATLKQDEIRVEVYPFMERLRQHPDADFLQILLPVMLSSPCVDTKLKKDGC